MKYNLMIVAACILLLLGCAENEPEKHTNTLVRIVHSDITNPQITTYFFSPDDFNSYEIGANSFTLAYGDSTEFVMEFDQGGYYCHTLAALIDGETYQYDGHGSQILCQESILRLECIYDPINAYHYFIMAEWDEEWDGD